MQITTRMRISLLAFFITSFTSVWAQTAFNADSVVRIFESLPDTIKIREANNLMNFYMDRDVKKSMYYAKEAFKLVDHIDNKKDVAYTYISWAISQYNFGKYDSCLYFNLKALNIYKTLQDTVKMAVAFNNISTVYNALGDPGASAYYSYKAFKIYESKKNWRKAAISCLNLGSSFYEAGDYDATLRWSRKGYNYHLLAEEPVKLGYAMQMYIDVYIARKQIDSALYYLREVQQLNKEHPNEYLEIVNLSQRGQVYLLEGKPDSAILMAQRCLSFYDKLEMSESIFYTRLLIARAYLAAGQWDDALQYAREGHAFSKQTGNWQMIIKSSDVLADIFKKTSQPEQALRYAQVASVYKDSLMQRSLRGSIEGRFFDVKLEEEIQKKLQAMDTLRQQGDIIETQWVLIMLITAGLVVMAIITYLIMRAGRSRKKLNNKLVASNSRLNELVEEVKGLMNTIVHDLKSPLNSVQGVLTILQSKQISEQESAELINLAKKSVNNGHEIIQQLMELQEVEDNPVQLKISQIDVPDLIQDICSGFLFAAQQKDILFTTELAPCILLSDKTLLQRILINLVSNAIKFSSSDGEVKITLKKELRAVIIQVSDKGPGFNEDDLKKIYGKFQKLSARPTGGENSTGLGLATVNLLVKHLGGTLELETQVGVGSVFSVMLQDHPSFYQN